MPLLTWRNSSLARQTRIPDAYRPESGERIPTPPYGRSSHLLETCSNTGCGSGWLHLWRSRNGPLVEGGWTCSAACTAERLKVVVARELDGRGPTVEKHRHRVPLGLLMLEHGWITARQLRGALQGQRENGAGRLVRAAPDQGLVSEHIGCSNIDDWLKSKADVEVYRRRTHRAGRSGVRWVPVASECQRPF